MDPLEEFLGEEVVSHLAFIFTGTKQVEIEVFFYFLVEVEIEVKR